MSERARPAEYKAEEFSRWGTWTSLQQHTAFLFLAAYLELNLELVMDEEARHKSDCISRPCLVHDLWFRMDCRDSTYSLLCDNNTPWSSSNHNPTVVMWSVIHHSS